MYLADEVISILWPWVKACEEDPDDYANFGPIIVKQLQLDLLRACEMLRLATDPTKES